MNAMNQYDDLFTFSKDAQLWRELYEKPTELYHHHMARRRDYAHAYTLRRFDKTASVLDLGCGAGVLMERLLESGYKTTGADVSEDMLALARERLSRFPAGDFRLWQANCESLPFRDGEFDVVLCMGVFGYVEDVDRAVGEIRRVLKPGGIFLMSVRNRANNILSDPYRTTVWGVRQLGRLVGLRSLKRKLAPGDASSREAADPGRFHIVIYDSPGNVIRGVSARGFSLELFDGFGFGPISLFKKELLPVSASVKLSDWLNRTFRRMKVAPLAARLADVSMYVFRKDETNPDAARLSRAVAGS
jgi:ubiquinone/menaquinone biosynthesis C-methylase UbiE